MSDTSYEGDIKATTEIREDNMELAAHMEKLLGMVEQSQKAERAEHERALQVLRDLANYVIRFYRVASGGVPSDELHPFRAQLPAFGVALSSLGIERDKETGEY